MVSEQKELIALEKSRFKSALIAAHPQHAEEILANDDEDKEADPDSFEAFDEDEDHTLTAEDFAAMEGILQNIDASGFDITEYE